MTSFLMKPRVVPVGRSVDDTVAACGSISKAYRYCHAQAKPNFPVPAIPYEARIHENIVLVVRYALDASGVLEYHHAAGWRRQT